MDAARDEGNGIMTRALELEELQRVAPSEAPPEPIPEFTHIRHDGYTWCGYAKGKYGDHERGHLYSTVTNRAQRVAMWQSNQLYGDGSLTIDWVENGWKVCPHCERDKWSEENKDALAAQRRYAAEEIAIAKAEAGEWTPKKKRAVILREHGQPETVLRARPFSDFKTTEELIEAWK
jgi:hypothetical protein